jgi:RNA polymerase sigma-70 factor (ECF subfamily)
LSLSDADLIKRSQAGDERAFVALYEQYQPAVYTYLCYRLGDGMLAEDLTAEVFIRLLDRLATLDVTERPLLAWLYTIAANLSIDHQRKNGRYQWLPLDEERDQQETETSYSADARLAQETLAKALNNLTEEQRQVVLLKFVEGRSNAEVGAILGKNEGSIKSLQHRALAALRRLLVKDFSHERV